MKISRRNPISLKSIPQKDRINPPPRLYTRSTPIYKSSKREIQTGEINSWILEGEQTKEIWHPTYHQLHKSQILSTPKIHLSSKLS